MKNRGLVFYVLLAICGTICVAASFFAILFNNDWDESVRQRRATREAEENLTNTYGEVVRDAIRQFELVNRSDEAIRDPSFLSQVTTGQLLKERVRTFTRLNEAKEVGPNFLKYRDVQVAGVNVVEYTPNRFKAVACVRETEVTMSSGGFPLNNLSSQIIIAYVFYRTEDKWKAALIFPVWYWEAAIHDWYDAEDWQKEIMGELPVGKDPICK